MICRCAIDEVSYDAGVQPPRASPTNWRDNCGPRRRTPCVRTLGAVWAARAGRAKRPTLQSDRGGFWSWPLLRAVRAFRLALSRQSLAGFGQGASGNAPELSFVVVSLRLSESQLGPWGRRSEFLRWLLSLPLARRPHYSSTGHVRRSQSIAVSGGGDPHRDQAKAPSETWAIATGKGANRRRLAGKSRRGLLVPPHSA